MGFKCIPDCSECCTVFHIPLSIWQKHEHKAERVKELHEVNIKNMSDGYPSGIYIIPMTTDLKSCFLKDNKCKIYKDRPIVCRRYGLHEDLPCVYVTPQGWKRTPFEQELWRTKSLEINNYRHFMIEQERDREIAREESR